ncbi:MAG: hypothetical protein ACE5GO_11550, partial [Anaerolineales bacterium]
MNRIFRTIGSLAAGVVAGLFWAGTVSAQVDIPGETDLSVPGSPTFNLVAKAGYISNPDGNTIYSWGYASGTGVMQYPG